MDLDDNKNNYLENSIFNKKLNYKYSTLSKKCLQFLSSSNMFSQSEDSDSSTNTDETIKCGMCDFKYIRITDLKRHKERIHSWCSFCHSTFDSQETLETHKKSVHSDN